MITLADIAVPEHVEHDVTDQPPTRSAWDVALTLGGALPALLFGVAFTNLFLGVPFHFDDLRRPVVTGSFFSLLHPFALLGGVISLSMLILHGNAYAALKVGEPGTVADINYLDEQAQPQHLDAAGLPWSRSRCRTSGPSSRRS